MEHSIELYHDLYIICGSLGLVFIVLALILYYAFDIKKIVKDMLGITKKTAIKEMEERDDRILKYQQKIREMQQMAEKAAAKVKAQFVEQEASDQDRKRHRMHLQSKEASEQKDEFSELVSKDEEEATKMMHSMLSIAEPTALSDESKEQIAKADTARLSADNMIHYQESDNEFVPKGDTMVLNLMPKLENVEEQQGDKKRQIRFIIEKQILMTHTDEIIDY